MQTEPAVNKQLKSLKRTDIGAQPLPEGGVRFSVWSPKCKSIAIQIDGRASVPMQKAEDGYWSLVIADAAAGQRYRVQVDGEEAHPDPASRFQPEGPHGPSQIVDAAAYAWRSEEARWAGIKLEGQVLYELHIGTFTEGGTYSAAEAELPRLRELGITVLELMPLAQFQGAFGWGYDGVDLFAPHNSYGTPDELRHLIEAAHATGLGVILDVVYNHLGPDGNYLPKFSPDYFAAVATEWGDSINFDGDNCEGVRNFFVENAAYWIRDFHFDGLRLDATQSIKDNGRLGKHVLQEIGEAAREAAGLRNIIIVAENEPQEVRLIRPVTEGGYGLDGMWNDDLHHSMMVRLTLRREAYYSDHLGRAQEFVSAIKYGYLFQGQYYAWQGNVRGTTARGVGPQHFITFLENHDQIANTDTGSRVRARSHPGVYRAMTAMWLLTPGTPMFFQGQEYGGLSKFLYFCDHAEPLAEAVRTGRRDFLGQFPSLASKDSQDALPDPTSVEAFRHSRLEAAEQARYPQMTALHTDLLALRRSDPVLSTQASGGLDGAVLSEDCFVIRFFAPDGMVDETDRLLVVNFGCDLDLPHSPEPLLAAPHGTDWVVQWSSDHHRYGGGGVTSPVSDKGWRISGAATVLLVLQTEA